MPSIPRNDNFSKLQASYLFRAVAEKRDAFKKANPDKKVISLGVGDTTRPLPPFIGGAIEKAAKALQTEEGYSGYPDWNGKQELRELIAKECYGGRVDAEEIIVSDGSKPDLARLQLLFSSNVQIAVTDPVYPAYVDGSVISGKTGCAEEKTGQYDQITYLACTPENDFFPDLSKPELKGPYVLFFCSPNNPTGTCASKPQLEKLVAFAKSTGSVIIFDTAYSGFVGSGEGASQDYPRSIYEVEGGRDVVGNLRNGRINTSVRLRVPSRIQLQQGFRVDTLVGGWWTPSVEGKRKCRAVPNSSHLKGYFLGNFGS